jgi:ubiquinone biosynthesis protein COQ9
MLRQITGRFRFSPRSFSSQFPKAHPDSEDYDIKFKKPEPFVFNELKDAALAKVSEYGWNAEAIEKGLESLSFENIAADVTPFSLVEYFLDMKRSDMNKKVAEIADFEALRIPQKIRKCCEIRLKSTMEYQENWHQAMRLLASPENLKASTAQLYELVDDIWFACGDRSLDFNFYSKRMMLAGVYTSTELFMVQDSSPGFEETLGFLDRRLSDVGKFGMRTNDLKQFISFGSAQLKGIIKTKMP